MQLLRIVIVGWMLIADCRPSSLDRIARGQPIDLVGVDLTGARIVLMPGESFVGYQQLAQKLSGDVLTMSIGYGECWPGYIPTQRAFDENFDHDWRWVAKSAAATMEKALTELLARE